MNTLFVFTEASGGMGSLIPMALLIVAMIAMFVFTSRSNKKQEREAQNMQTK